MASLEERLTILEDIEAIRKLKAYYAACADAKYTDNHERKPQDELDAVAWDQSSIFTEDAIWDGGEQFGVLHGRQAIYDSLRLGPWKFAIHMYMSPVINVEGDKASAQWDLWQVGTLKKKDTPVFLSAFTNDEYVKIDGKWLMSKMVFTLKFMTPFDQPWTVNKNGPLVI